LGRPALCRADACRRIGFRPSLWFLTSVGAQQCFYLTEIKLVQTHCISQRADIHDVAFHRSGAGFPRIFGGFGINIIADIGTTDRCKPRASFLRANAVASRDV
jgi:hypothetical protein